MKARAFERPHYAYIVGLFVGLSFTIPFLGRFLGIPMSSAAVPLSFVTTLLLFALRPRLKFANMPSAVLIILAALYAVLIFRSASSSQIDFIFFPHRWMDHARLYYESKFVMFLLAFVPSVTPVAILILTPMAPESRDRVAQGFLFAGLTIALLAALRVLQLSDLLIGTDRFEVAKFPGEAYSLGFNTVSFGVLFIIGSAAAMALPKTWPLTAIFLIMAFWLNRKTETILIIILIAGFTFRWLRHGDWSFKQLKVWRFVPIIVSSVLVISAIYNESNVVNWQYFTQSINYRISMAIDAMTMKPALLGNTELAFVPSEQTEQIISQKAQADIDSLSASDRGAHWDFLLGHGLGWYSTVDSVYQYPHNILIENYLESGILSAAILAFLAVAVCGFALLAAVRSELSAAEISVAFIVGAYFLFGLKAGELTTASRLIALLLFSAYLTGPRILKTQLSCFGKRSA